MSEVNFILDSEKKLILMIPGISEKLNYFYKPTPKIQRFDEVVMSYIQLDVQIQLKKDTIHEIIGTFHALLVQAIKNDLRLPSNLKIGSLGKVLNNLLNDSLDDDIVRPFWLWSNRSSNVTFLYNVDDKIYLEIAPLYPYLFSERIKEDETFDEFMKSYKPFVVEAINTSTAIEWQKKCESLLNSMDSEG